jgi:hypothetical protein
MGLCENLRLVFLFSGPVLIDPHLGGTVILEIKRNVVTEVGLFGICNVKKEQKFLVSESCLWYTSWLISY